MDLAITTLVENSRGDNKHLQAEHGLSFHVVAGETSFLFDTGASSLFLDNAKSLGIPVEATTNVVISHGHYDHSSGYPAWLDLVDPTETHLFVKPGFFDPKFCQNLVGLRTNGNPFTREDIQGRGVTIHELQDNVTELFPGVHSISGFPRSCPFEPTDPRYLVSHNGSLTGDDFSDEQALVLESKEGLVVLLGCSHPGVINIIDKVKATFSEPIHAIIGGTHLVVANESRIKQTAERLVDEKIPKVMFSHCSGSPEHLGSLISQLGDTFCMNNTGTAVTF